MSEDNLAFYERRARQEAQAAASASSPAMASAHRLLSIQYEDRAGELRAEGQCLHDGDDMCLETADARPDARR